MSGSVSYCGWASGVNIVRKTEIADPAPSECIGVDISDLHDRCGIYTDHETANFVLKKIGWTKFNSLRKARLLEPCAGDGALLIVAIRELIGSFRKHEIPLHFKFLSSRIIAFEIHPREAQKARKAAVFELTTLGLSASLAGRLANEWIRTEDFLLTPMADPALLMLWQTRRIFDGGTFLRHLLRLIDRLYQPKQREAISA